MEFKWEAVKRDVRATMNTRALQDQMRVYALMETIHSGEYNWRKSTDKLLQQSIQIIDRWDIRQARQLIAIFPESIPKKYRDLIPTCEYDEKGEWILIY